MKLLAKRQTWGATIDETMALFLDRLWGDSLDVSLSSFSLTPWNQVCPATPLSSYSLRNAFDQLLKHLPSLLITGNRLTLE